MKAFDLVDIYNLAEIVALAKIPSRTAELQGLNRAEYLSQLMLFRETCDGLGFDSTVRQINRLEQLIRANQGFVIEDVELWDVVRPAAVEMGVRFLEEIGAVHAYHLSAQDQSLYLEPTKDWRDALDKFPSALNDVQEAGRCLALGRHTAAVFHAMRILEFGLAPLGSQFSVSTDRATWHRIIEQIHDAIEAKSLAMGGGWADQSFYSDAATQMTFFKDAWRNHVMHARVTFNEETAPPVIEYVRRFMAHLATKLAE